MDDYLSLRSLEGTGRPFGTGRPSSPFPRARTDAAERRSENVSERQESEEPESAPERSEFERELDRLEERTPTERVLTPEPSTEFPEPGSAQPIAREELRSEQPAAEVKNEQSAAVAQAVPTANPLAQLDAQPVLEPAPTQAGPQPTAPTQPAPTAATPAVPVAPIAEARVELGTDQAAAQLAQTVSAPSEGASPDAGFSNLEFGTQARAEGEVPLVTQNATQTATFENTLQEISTKAATAATQDLEVVESVLRQFKVELNPKLDRAVIQLHPAELGRIAVKLELDRGKLRAVMRADRAETLEILERHVPELRAALSSNGIEAETFDFDLGFEEDAQPQPESTSEESKATSEDLETHTLLAQRIVSDVRVDTYA